MYKYLEAAPTGVFFSYLGLPDKRIPEFLPIFNFKQIPVKILDECQCAMAFGNLGYFDT